MPDRKCAPRQPAELRVRGVRLFKENRPDCSSCSAAYASIAEKLGCSRFPLREWCIQAEREVKELRTANEILKKASACFARAELYRTFRR